MSVNDKPKPAALQASQPVLVVKGVSVPVPDTNGNDTFDGDDLRMKLSKEVAEIGVTSAATPRAHQLMAFIEIHDLTDQVLDQIKKQNGCDAYLMAAAGQMMSERLGQVTAIYEDKSSKQDREQVEREALGASWEAKQGPAAADRTVTTMNSVIDFAATLRGAFPEGIRIEGHQVPALLEHFEDDEKRLELLRSCPRTPPLKINKGMSIE